MSGTLEEDSGRARRRGTTQRDVAAGAVASAASRLAAPPTEAAAGRTRPSIADVRATAIRPTVRGKFLHRGEAKLYLRGVTYGTFRRDANGDAYPDPATVERDFREMRSAGINSLRTYTVPPRWLLDTAHRHGLLVMIGHAWEQHIAFLDDRGRSRDIARRMRAGARACAGHPAVLGHVIGNEVPATVVRWLGRARVERFLSTLYAAVKGEDPDALVSYVNYPTTEYLELPFLDFSCFNVYLESRERLEAYLARLHNRSGDRPLVLAEIGLDSRTHGHAVQADVLQWQIEAAFTGGCAGAFVFAWTDEWHITHFDAGGAGEGFEVEDWDFGLTTRDRRSKPALAAARDAFDQAPVPQGLRPLRFTVVVCTYNGERTIRDCLEGILALQYDDFEVVVVDDGSTDGTAAIVAEYPFALIRTENRGLSNARNTAMAAANGDVVAYVDDDAWPDPHWLTYLAAAFGSSTYVAVGGPNLPPPGDGMLADCVADAPGGPVHVLLSDREAEHLPGCNLAVRTSALAAIGGFDPQFRTAGDDVDVCWRLREKGGTLGFHPAAMVWHRRRSSLLAYWRQQRGYGRAEALLERKWPERYNAAGYLRWQGQAYGGVLTRSVLGRARIYQGTWGSAPFQALYQPAPGLFPALPAMPEWYAGAGFLLALSVLAPLWPPLIAGLPLAAAALGTSAGRALIEARRAGDVHRLRPRWRRLPRLLLTTVLHLVQPFARLRGRLQSGLTPWRRRGPRGFAFPWPRTDTVWSDGFQPADRRLHALRSALRRSGAVVRCGGAFDRWDLEVRGGLFGGARLRMLVEEHPPGGQLVRIRRYPIAARLAPITLLVFGSLLAASRPDGMQSLVIAALAMIPVVGSLQHCGTGMALVASAGHDLPPDGNPTREAWDDQETPGAATA
jgi:GT2 family glycosyltransferase